MYHGEMSASDDENEYTTVNITEVETNTDEKVCKKCETKEEPKTFVPLTFREFVGSKNYPRDTIYTNSLHEYNNYLQGVNLHHSVQGYPPEDVNYMVWKWDIISTNKRENTADQDLRNEFFSYTIDEAHYPIVKFSKMTFPQFILHYCHSHYCNSPEMTPERLILEYKYDIAIPYLSSKKELDTEIKTPTLLHL
jgi:hypothetical protein